MRTQWPVSATLVAEVSPMRATRALDAAPQLERLLRRHLRFAL